MANEAFPSNRMHASAALMAPAVEKKTPEVLYHKALRAFNSRLESWLFNFSFAQGSAASTDVAGAPYADTDQRGIIVTRCDE